MWNLVLRVGWVLVGALILTAIPDVAVADIGSGCSENQVNCPESTGDQQAGGVATTAGLPAGKADGSLATAISDSKSCKDCEWSVVPACLVSGPVDSGVCAGAVNGCPDPADVRYRVYLRHGDGPWTLQGTVCLGPEDGPPPVVDVGQAVRERVIHLLPDAAPSFQPASGGIVNLPTIFAAGEPKTMHTGAFDVLGFSVEVTAEARWEWSFEPGVAQVFHEPGGPYPDDAVAHTYADGGTRRVALTTYWKASFTVNGEGPFAVPGPEIAKTATPLTVPVREAHSQLVSN